MHRHRSVIRTLTTALILAAASTAQASLIFEQVTSFGTGLGKPVRVAATANGWAATYPRSNKAVIFDSVGSVIREITGLRSPLGIAFLTPDSLFIGEQNPARISVWKTDGTFIRSIGDGLIMKPSDIAVYSSGGNKVYVVDPEARYVRVFDDLGNRLPDIGGPSKLLFPTGVAVDPRSGTVLVGEMITGIVHVFGLNGIWQRDISSFGAGSGQFTRVQGITCSDLGAPSVADPFLSRVQSLSSMGAFLAATGTYGSGAGQLNLPFDTAINPQQRLLVADFGNQRFDLFKLAYDSAAEAQALPDNVFVNFSGPIVTAGTPDFGTSVYIEAPGRSSGIRVANVTGTLNRGSVVTVSGTTKTLSGERYIDASGQSVSSGGPAAVPAPLALTGAVLGGASLNPASAIPGTAGLYNVGLLVRVAGKIESINGSDFFLNDGSSQLIWIYAPGISSTHIILGNYVGVTGVCSAATDTGGTLRARVRPRNASDINRLK